MIARKKEVVIGLNVLLIFILLFLALLLHYAIYYNVDVAEAFQNSLELEKGKIRLIENPPVREYQYIWYYQGQQYTLSNTYEESDYLHFKKLKRIETADYSYYIQPDIYDEYQEKDTSLLFQKIKHLAEKNMLTEQEIAGLILSFVQNIPAEEDNDNYFKYPYETLYENKGDCEDMAILASYLLNKFDIDNVIIETEDHVGLGIAVPSEGLVFNFNDKEYYYAETTGSGYHIGEKPDSITLDEIKIYHTDVNSIIDYDWNIKENDGEYMIEVELENIALKKIMVNLTFFIEYQSPYHETWTNHTLPILKLDGRSKVKLNRTLEVDKRAVHRIGFTLSSDYSHLNPFLTRTKWIYG